MRRLNTILLGLGTLVLLLLTAVSGNSVLVSPSHPFVDDNGNGIDDFEEGHGRYGDPNVRAQIYGVTFPIAELAGCADYASCRSYCEDPVNANSCISYARSRGFYKEETDEKVKEILTRAKTALGCDSYESCQNFCEIAANYDKCNSFAQGQGLVGGYVHNPEETRIMDQAKQTFGCTSPDACRSFCEQEANRDKCTDFARSMGLRGGEHPVGPGGCTSEATCKAFCSDPNNYQICSGFHQTTGGTFSGPGGCTSEESCRTYCQQNPQACGYGGPGGPPPGYTPQEMCNRTANCAWLGNTCQCTIGNETIESQNKAREYASLCQANPDKCKVGPGGYPIPGDVIPPDHARTGGYQDYGDYCKQYPDRCKAIETTGTTGGYTDYHGDPAAECTRYGCSWTGSTCQCTGISGGTYTPPSSYTEPSPGTGTYTPPSSYTQPPGYTPPPSYTQPEGGYTQPPHPPAEGYTPPPTTYSQPSYTPPPETQTNISTPPPTQESGSYTPHPEVHGISTARDLLQSFLQFIDGLLGR